MCSGEARTWAAGSPGVLPVPQQTLNLAGQNITIAVNTEPAPPRWWYCNAVASKMSQIMQQDKMLIMFTVCSDLICPNYFWIELHGGWPDGGLK